MKDISSQTQVRVRYQETDNMGVVYYSNYLVWFEIARTEYFRALGLVYRELEKKGIYLMVASVTCQYKSPARYDDLVNIRSRVSELKNSSLKFEYELHVDQRFVAKGESVHVFTNEAGRPVRIPEEVRGLYKQ